MFGNIFDDGNSGPVPPVNQQQVQYYYVRTEYQGKRKFVVTAAMIRDNFELAAKSTFDIAHNEKLLIFDEMRTEIPMECLEYFFFKNPDQCFRLMTESESASISELGSLQDLSNLRSPTVGSSSATSDSAGTSISTLSDSEKTNEQTPAEVPKTLKTFFDGCNYKIDDKDAADNRVDIVRKCCEYMVLRFGHHPPSAQKIAVAKELVELYPSLRCTEPGSEGYEAFADPKNHAGGFFSNRFKTVNARLNKIKRKRNPARTVDEETVSIDDEQFLGALQELRSVVPSSNDLPLIFELTLKYAPLIRKYLVDKKTNISLKEDFPRFYDVKGLIQACFEKAFNKTLPAFSDWWNSHKDAVGKVTGEKLRRNIPCVEDWPEDVQDFLTFVFLFPSHEKQTSKESNQSYDERVVSSIIRFKKVNVPLTESLTHVTTNEPFIFAEGVSKDTVTKFFVVVDCHPVSPAEPEFFKAFDLLFMCYFLFNISYHPSSSTFLKFLDAYIYKISSKVTYTAKMRETYANIMKKKELLEEDKEELDQVIA